MNHDAPRQKKDGTWGYTTLNSRDSQPYAIGYCSPFQEWSDETIALIFGGEEAGRERYEAYIEPFRQLRHKFHDGGHPDKEAACECFKEYILDHELTLHMHHLKDGVILRACAHDECNELTSGYAQAGKGIGTLIPLCPEHLNRETVGKLFQVRERWHS